MATDTKTYACPQCGSKGLAYEPRSGKLQCSYCGYQEVISQSSELVREQPYEQALRLDRQQLEVLSPQALEIKCPSCGAITTFVPPQVAGDCPFCSTHLNAQPRPAAPALVPNGILPFKLDRKAIQPHLQHWLGSNWFAPNDLKKLAQPETIQGVYLPFWTFDALTISDYQGERGEHYYVTETYQDSDGKTQTREVRHTHWYSTSGRVERAFDDVLIPATRSLSYHHLKQLEPWHYEGSLRVYSPEFLAGYKVERYQSDLRAGFEQAQQEMAEGIRADIRADIGGDEQRINKVSTAYQAVTFKHLLMPIWMFSYRYRGKTYQVVVNARTGEVQGDHPLSVWKIALAATAAVLAVGIIIWVFSRR